MEPKLPDMSRRTAAIVAFLGLVVTLIGVGIAVGGGAPPNLASAADFSTTARAVLAAGDGFRVGLFGWLLVALGDVVRAWALYVFFRPVHRSLALLAAWGMLLHDAVLGGGVAALLTLSTGLAGAGAFGGAALAPTDPLVGLLLGVFASAFSVGLFFFSFHLLLNGWLVLKSGDVPRILGVLLIVAFVGYQLDSLSAILLPDRPPILPAVVALPNTVGELALVVWMVFRGGRTRPA